MTITTVERSRELAEQVRMCIEWARQAVVDALKPQFSSLVSAAAAATASTVANDSFATPEDIARWTAGVLERAIDERDRWRSPAPYDEIGTRVAYARELAKWLFPSFGDLPTCRDEIARLRVWPEPYVAGDYRRTRQ